MSYRVSIVENKRVILEYIGIDPRPIRFLYLPSQLLEGFNPDEPPNSLTLDIGLIGIDVNDKLEVIPYTVPPIEVDGKETETPGSLSTAPKLSGSSRPLGRGHSLPKFSTGATPEDAGELQRPDAGASKAV